MTIRKLLAKKMRITEEELLSLLSENHYTIFTIRKHDGRPRQIASPDLTLRIAQSWIKKTILDKVNICDEAHGFVKGRSTYSNALIHAGNELVINIDLKDFFPSIDHSRVTELFLDLGWSPDTSAILATLCTKDGVLPQGVSTSPAITNIICIPLDKKLLELSNKVGLNYSRYADDISFSGGYIPRKRVDNFLELASNIVKVEGFQVNSSKTKVNYRGTRQEVTGIVVNDKPSIRRKDIKRLRAIIHNCKIYGFESQNKNNHPNFFYHLYGLCSYIMMIDNEKGKKLIKSLNEALTASDNRW